MTKEELEKKAEEHSVIDFPNDEFYQAIVKKAYLAGAKAMQEENEQLKQQIEKMKCCHSCLSHKLNNLKNCQTCDGNYSKWEIAE